MFDDRHAPDDYGFIQSTIYTVTGESLRDHVHWQVHDGRMDTSEAFSKIRSYCRRTLRRQVEVLINISSQL